MIKKQTVRKHSLSKKQFCDYMFSDENIKQVIVAFTNYRSTPYRSAIKPIRVQKVFKDGSIENLTYDDLGFKVDEIYITNRSKSIKRAYLHSITYYKQNKTI